MRQVINCHLLDEVHRKRTKTRTRDVDAIVSQMIFTNFLIVDF